MSVRVIEGDCRQVLKTLPPDSVHCCITSPPYWGLRSYGIGTENGEIGLESTFTDFISEMVAVFREVRRVLRPDGTLFLNLGDSYFANGPRQTGRNDTDRETPGGRGGSFRGGVRRAISCDTSGREPPGSLGSAYRDYTTASLKPKDLIGIPWRVAFALQEDGWYLRQDIVWSKKNPMPESVSDRCTKSHEYLFLMTKSARYYFDADAIKETPVFYANRLSNAPNKRDGSPETGLAKPSMPRDYVESRNKRSVWEIATSPFPEAHFATFPPALVEPCIKAGTSEKGCCRECGAPWMRDVERGLTNTDGWGTTKKDAHGGSEGSQSMARDGKGRAGDGWAKTLGWSPSCKCRIPGLIDATAWTPKPCTVLDPFGGAGTTGLVADRLQRNAILIELNPQYAEMARRRIFRDAPLFATLETAVDG